MIKVLNQYFPHRLFVLLVTENVLILSIWAGASNLLGEWQAGAYPWFVKALLATLVCELCLHYADIYDLRSVGSGNEVFFRLLQALGAATLLLTGFSRVFPAAAFDGTVVGISILFTGLAILLWRLVVGWITRTYGAKEKILLVGSGPLLRHLAREIRHRPDLPIELVGAVPEREEDPNLIQGLERLGTLSQLESIVSETAPHRVIIGLGERRQVLPTTSLLKMRMRGLVIEEASTLYQKLTGKIPVESIHPSSLIFSSEFSQSSFRRVYARISSLLGAIAALILCGPLMLLVCIAIKLDSAGPILYGQTRTGKSGNLFEVLKFRSMRADAESSTGPVWALEKDPRVTRVGRVIRTLRLDELPQLLNVLYGHMGFVGPRPERPHFVAQLVQQIPFYDLRHSIRPGITGWAQVSCDYGATVEESRLKLEYDLFYIQNVSFWLDLMILFQTIKIVLLGRGAR